MPEVESMMNSRSAIDADTEGVERIAEEVLEIQEPCVPLKSDHHRPSTPLPLTSTGSSSDSSEDATRIDYEVGQNIGAWAQDPLPGGPVDVEEVVIGPEQFDGPRVSYDTPSQPAPEASAPPPALGPTSELLPAAEGDSSASQTPGRAFPPPGTLVVVQGVVHTTDVPHPLLSNDMQEATRRSSSTPPNPSGRRNRLSALLRSRPSSMVGPRAHSATDSSSLAPPLPMPVDPATSSSTDLPAASTESRSNSTSQLENTGVSVQDGFNQPTDAPTTTEQPGTISSSSIDILGTLLRYVLKI